MLQTSKKKAVSCEGQELFKPISMESITLAFVMLPTGIIIALIVFIIEKFTSYETILRMYVTKAFKW